MALARSAGSPDAYSVTAADPNVFSTNGRRLATTGLAIAPYSKIFVDRLSAVNALTRGGASPIFAPAIRAGTTSGGNPPGNPDASTRAGRGGRVPRPLPA